ncbi:MAG: hypothetical protein WBB22_07415, partial [Anaerolineae bacterium]
MTAHRKTTRAEQEDGGIQKGKQPTEQGQIPHSQPVHQAAAQRAIEDPLAARQKAALQLQGKIGNQAMGRLIAQTKQSEGAPGAHIQKMTTEAEGPLQSTSSTQHQTEEELIQGKPLVQRQEEENKVRMQPAVREIRRKDYSVYRQPEEEGLQTERQGPPARHIVPPTSTIQKNDVSWEVHSWKLEPEKPLPIMTGNEYADWIEGSKTEEPTSMNCWQALLFSLYKAGTLSRSQLKAIHIRTKVLALTQIPMEKITPQKAKMFAVQYDVYYARALKVVINDAPWKRITTRRWNEDIPAGSIIRINQGSKVLHWLLSVGTERVADQV